MQSSIGVATVTFLCNYCNRAAHETISEGQHNVPCIPNEAYFVVVVVVVVVVCVHRRRTS